MNLKRGAFHTTPPAASNKQCRKARFFRTWPSPKGESAGSQTAQLLKLLDEYGAVALRRAILEALERQTPRACSVAFLLRRQPHPRRVLDLSGHPEAPSIDVRPHNLETYDELAYPQDDDPEQ